MNQAFRNGGFLNAQNSASGLRQSLRRFIDERGYQYAEDYFTYTVSTTGNLAAGASQVVPLNIQNDSAFEWILATGNVDTAGAKPFSSVPAVDVTLIDSVSARNLMNGNIPFANLFGTGQQPFTLPIPRRFMMATQIQVVFHNYSAATTYSRVSISLIGRKIFQQALPGGQSAPLARFATWRQDNTAQLFSEDLYMYDFPNAANLAAAASIPVTNIIEGDSDFEWIATTFAEGIAAGVTAGPAASAVFAQVLDGGSQRNLFNASTPVALIAGTAAFPAILQQPRIFPAKTPVTVTYTNNGAAGTDNIRLTMIGRKIFQLDQRH